MKKLLTVLTAVLVATGIAQAGIEVLGIEVLGIEVLGIEVLAVGAPAGSTVESWYVLDGIEVLADTQPLERNKSVSFKALLEHAVTDHAACAKDHESHGCYPRKPVRPTLSHT